MDSSYTAPDNTTIAEIKNKVDTLENTDLTAGEIWQYPDRELTNQIISIDQGERNSQVIEEGIIVTGQIIEVG